MCTVCYNSISYAITYILSHKVLKISEARMLPCCKHVTIRTLLRYSLISAVWLVIIFIFYIDFNITLSPTTSVIKKEQNEKIKNLNMCPPQFTNKVPQISNDSLTHFCGPNGYDCSEKYAEGILYRARYIDTMQQRREDLESMLSSSMIKENDAVILMSVNFGFSWLFANWACSLEHNLKKNQIEEIKQRTIVLVTDERAQKVVNSMGFMTHYPNWLGTELLSQITEDGAHSFGIGSHIEINALSIALLNDLIQLNYSVLMQDVDLVWKRDPINYLMTSAAADLSMSSDGRSDEKGPGNSGFLFLRSNCKTKVFAETLWNARSQIDGSSDQLFWNTLLDDRVFRQMHFTILDEQLFANGHSITLARGGTLHSEHFIFHASWTRDIFDKIEKFWNTQHFYYTPQLCAYYDERMIVDVSKRKVNNREQEDKFLQLGLFKKSFDEDKL